MTTSPRNPTRAQVQAINVILEESNVITRTAHTEWIKQLPSVLREDELPEKMLTVDFGMNNNALMVVTNHRVLLLCERLFSSKFKVQDFPCYEITDVEFSPGLLTHGIKVSRGKKKMEIRGKGIEGKFRARKMAEHLATKIASGNGSIAKDPTTRRLHELDDLIRGRNGQFPSGAMKCMAEALEEDEQPSSIHQAIYDDRHGMNVSSMSNDMGILLLTDRRLIFVSKVPMMKARVVSIPYGDIDRVSHTTGLMFGSISVWVDGVEERFDKLNSGEAERLAVILREETE